jgi:hypothetical protein
VYLRIWSVYCRSTGWPGSRAKVEFNSWESRGRVTENRMEERASKPSLEGVILPRSRFAFFGSKFHIKRRSGEEGVQSSTRKLPRRAAEIKIETDCSGAPRRQEPRTSHPSWSSYSCATPTPRNHLVMARGRARPAPCCAVEPRGMDWPSCSSSLGVRRRNRSSRSKRCAGRTESPDLRRLRASRGRNGIVSIDS